MPNGEELSEREQEILRLVATGVSNKEIAQQLSISPNTVKVHLRNIFTKINVVSRTEATLYALKTGIINSPATPQEPLAPAILPETTPEPQEDIQSTTLPDILPAVAVRRPSWPLMSVLAILLVLITIATVRMFSNLTPTATTTTPTIASIQRWNIETSLPQPVRSAAVAVFEQNAYLIGGSEAGGTSAQVLIYDFQNRVWTSGKEKPTPVELAGAALVGEEIYVPGGLGIDGKPTNVFEAYLPRANEWRTLAPLPRALLAYGLTAYEGQLYLFGGWDGSQYLDSVYIYDPQSDNWRTGQPMPQPRAHLAAAAGSGKILVMGGANDAGVLDLNTVYYPQRDLNGETAWEARKPLPEARSAFAAAVLADSVYLIGGNGKGEREPGAVIYNIIEDRWLSMEPLNSGTAAPVYGSFLIAVPWQTTVHIFGGELASQPVDRHLSYQAIYTVALPVLQNSGD